MSRIDEYRTCNLHDIVSIRRTPETGFDPEPDTLARVLFVSSLLHSLLYVLRNNGLMTFVLLVEKTENTPIWSITKMLQSILGFCSSL